LQFFAVEEIGDGHGQTHHLLYHLIHCWWEPTRKTNPEKQETVDLQKENEMMKNKAVELQKENEMIKKEARDLKATNVEVHKANEMLTRNVEERMLTTKDKKRKRSM
jgi:hypothetical protein